MAPVRLLAACLVFLFSAAAFGGQMPTAAADAQAGPAGLAAAPGQAPAGWTLVFSDEFDRPGAPDPAKWGYETGYIRNKEAQYYTSRRENVRVEGGNLVIERNRR